MKNDLFLVYFRDLLARLVKNDDDLAVQDLTGFRVCRLSLVQISLRVSKWLATEFTGPLSNRKLVLYAEKLVCAVKSTQIDYGPIVDLPYIKR